MQNDLVYDVGMYNGNDTAYYLHEGYRVLAIEANPVFAEQGAKRFAREIAEKRLTILNVGVAADGASMPFWVCENNLELSSFNREMASRYGAAHHAITVPCRRIGDIIAQYGAPFYMKIDIEGSDINCLRDMRGAEPPKYLSAEATDPGVLSALSDLGYNKFQCISQFHFAPVEIPPHPEHQRLEKLRQLQKDPSLGWRLARLLGARVWLRRKCEELDIEPIGFFQRRRVVRLERNCQVVGFLLKKCKARISITTKRGCAVNKVFFGREMTAYSGATSTLLVDDGFA